MMPTMTFFLSFGLVFSVIPTSLSLSTGYSSAITLELRHQHAATYDGRVVFADIPTSSTAFAQSTLDGPYAIDTALLKTHHLPAGVSPESLRQTRRLRHQTKREHAGGQAPFNRQFETANGQSYPEDDPVSGWWEEEEIEGPDISKRSTLQLLAKMTNNAYLQPNETGWYDIGSQWNSVRQRIHDQHNNDIHYHQS
jgi:lipase ATG15